LGLLLSGGVDSTLLLALAKKEGFTLPTYSIINTSREKSFGTKDYYYSRKASSLYSSDHHELEVDISLLKHFDDFITKMDQPIGDSAYLMTSEICNHASKSLPMGQAGMKVLLSGAGADEIFAGYNRHLAYYNYLKNKKSIELLAPITKIISNKLPTGFGHPLRKQFRLAKKWASSIDPSPLKTFNNYLTFNELNFGLPDNKHGITDENWYGWALDYEKNNYLVSDVLALSDKASMLHGIELRVPYLNERLVAYLNAFQPEQRIRFGQKWILKEILNKYGGKIFVKRRKEGFGLPLSSWLFDKKARHLWEIFEPNHLIFDFLDKSLFNKIVDQQKRKVDDHGPLLWSILVLARWIQQNFQ
jgi:asparagine synthase (glutamine-hydrolysing)